MKKMIFTITTMCLIAASSNVSAGAVKDLLIDADDAIYSEFFENGLHVESIENHTFTPVSNGIGIKAEVETTNPSSNMGQSWTCIVTFKKIGPNYLAQDVDCK